MTTTLIQEDLHHVLSRLPRDIVKLLQEHPQLFVAGGFIRATIANECVNDIDLFGPSKGYLEGLAKTFALDRKARFHDTDNAFTVLTPGRTPVQFIHRWTYTKPSEVIVDFDFSIAQAVIYWEPPRNVLGTEITGTWQSIVSKHYYPDLASKRLSYLSPTRTEDAGGSLLRMRKFLNKGYHIEANSLGTVIARLAMGVDKIKTAFREGTHDEPLLAQVLTGLLREVDPLRVVDGLELVDEHEVDSAP